MIPSTRAPTNPTRLSPTSPTNARPFLRRLTVPGPQRVTPNTASRVRKLLFDKAFYDERHLIECCFSKLKQFCRGTSRYEKTAKNRAAVVATSPQPSSGYGKHPQMPGARSA
jgi:hypothetical protein